MKKMLLLAGALVVAASAMADDYNRVAISYDNTHYGYNKDAGGKEDPSPSFSTNGFGLNYIHGFGLSADKPMFIEVGGSLNFGFWGKTVKVAGDEAKAQFQNINLTIPVNFAWKFSCGDNFSITPYAGINFRLNMVEKGRQGYKEEGGKVKWQDKWTNYLSDKDEWGMGKDRNWNVFQMGWQVGATFQYSAYSIGIQYGTDFIPAYRHKFEEAGFKATPAVNTGNLKISLGYNF